MSKLRQYGKKKKKFYIPKKRIFRRKPYVPKRKKFRRKS